MDTPRSHIDLGRTILELLEVEAPKEFREPLPVSIEEGDRRANLLEDQHGMDVAEVRGDPELAFTAKIELPITAPASDK
mgnify:CR=1 FL=1